MTAERPAMRSAVAAKKGRPDPFHPGTARQLHAVDNTLSDESKHQDLGIAAPTGTPAVVTARQELATPYERSRKSPEAERSALR
jgi:hypothetical protein